jgi:topoisomerase-4 subunit A
MRYTESRLTPIAELLLEEVDQGTVDWTPNFDGTLKEPSWLPSRVPHVLLNGSTGIAVAWLPTSRRTTCAKSRVRASPALDEPEATIAGSPRKSRETAPRCTQPATARCVVARVDEGGRQRRRHCPALPGVAVEDPRTDRCANAREKLPMIEDIRDESDHENPIRIVLMPRSNRIDLDEMMQHLNATTDLEKSYRVNLNMIGLDGKPQVKNLKQILSEWLRFRADTVTKRLQFRLAKVERRLHLLEGLRIAYLNLDEVIRIIRTEEEPKPALIARFKLSEEQADYILETRLRQLARLEEMKINAERDELEEERARINVVLNSKARLKTLLKDELRKDAEKYGDARRSPLVARGRTGARRNRARRQRAGHRDPFRKRLGARGERP